MHTADALSRGTDMSTKLTKSAQEEDLKVYVDSVIKSLPISDRKLQMIREETQNDPKLQLLAEVIVTGFPEHTLNALRNIKILEYTDRVEFMR